MSKAEKENNPDALSFEQAIHSLKEIVGQIEDGEIPLQDSIAQYERGMKLIHHCRTILQQAEKRIEKIAEAKDAPEADEED